MFYRRVLARPHYGRCTCLCFKNGWSITYLLRHYGWFPCNMRSLRSLPKKFSDLYRIKKCPKGPRSNNDALHSDKFIIAFPGDSCRGTTEVYLSDGCRYDRSRVVSIWSQRLLSEPFFQRSWRKKNAWSQVTFAWVNITIPRVKA